MQDLANGLGFDQFGLTKGVNILKSINTPIQKFSTLGMLEEYPIEHPKTQFESNESSHTATLGGNPSYSSDSSLESSSDLDDDRSKNRSNKDNG